MPPTGGFFSNKRLALRIASDGVDVEAVERAGLQMGDFSVRVGGNGQLKGPQLGAVLAHWWEDHPVAGNLGGRTRPSNADPGIRNLVELQVGRSWDLFCGEEKIWSHIVKYQVFLITFIETLENKHLLSITS